MVRALSTRGGSAALTAGASGATAVVMVCGHRHSCLSMPHTHHDPLKNLCSIVARPGRWFKEVVVLFWEGVG